MDAIRIKTDRPRTMLPVRIEVPAGSDGKLFAASADAPVRRWVELAIRSDARARYAEFWAEREGSYDLRYVSRAGTEIRSLRVAPQGYLTFAREFGFFFWLWLAVMAMVVAAVWRVRWKEKTASR